MALGISAEEIAGELGITTDALVVVEAHETGPVGRAWDLALGHILHARQDAVQDEAKDATQEGDALRRWGEQRNGPKSARIAATVAAVPPDNTEPARVPVPSSQPRQRRKRAK